MITQPPFMKTVYVSTVISVNEFHFIGVFDNFLRFFTLKFSSSLAQVKVQTFQVYLAKIYLSKQTWILIGRKSDLLASNWPSALFLLQHNLVPRVLWLLLRNR